MHRPVPSAHEKRPLLSWPAFLLTLSLMWLCIASLRPYSPVETWHMFGERLLAGMSLSLDEPIFITLLQRAAVFLPFGLLLQWNLARTPAVHPARRAIMRLGLIVIGLEVGQGLLTTYHHPRFSEIMFGVAAGTAGVGLGMKLHALRAAIETCYLNHERAILLYVLTAGSLVTAYVLVRVHSGVDLVGWDHSYPLIVGNELTGDRPWRGRIHGLAIYDRQLSAADLESLDRASAESTIDSLRRRLGAIASYQFDSVVNGRLREQVSARSDLDLLFPPIDRRIWSARNGALELFAPTVIRTASSCAHICTALEASNAFTVEVVFASDDVSQQGPARIVSISAGPGARNFTIGQQLDTVNVRVRTPMTGPNGTAVPFRSGPSDITGGWHHLAVTFRDGVIRLYVDGVEARRPLRLYAASVRLFGHDAPASNILAAAVLFCPLGLLTGVVTRCRAPGPAATLTLVGLLALPLVCSVVAAGHFRHRHNMTFIVATIVICVVVILIARKVASCQLTDDFLADAA